jgi:hypothetical protein
MNLNPTRSRRYILSLILSTPSLDKGHSDDRHFGEFIAAVEAHVYAIAKQLKTG